MSVQRRHKIWSLVPPDAVSRVQNLPKYFASRIPLEELTALPRLLDGLNVAYF